jgi:thiol:disulfide interchange protein DsbA
MRRWITGLLCAFAFCAQASADYAEGVEYERISPPAPTSVDNGKVEVLEVFWYGCPHCYDFEPYLEKWLPDKPQAAQFVRQPAILNYSWIIHARMYYALDAIGEADRVHKAIFQAMHEQGRSLADMDSISRFLAQQGVDVKAFRKAFESPQAEADLERAAQLQRNYGITGVPSVIVDGKYRTSATQAGSYDEMLKVVNYLVAKEAGT